MDRINIMTVQQMSNISGLPVDVIQKRINEKKPQMYGTGQYKVLFDYVMPNEGKGGLVTAAWLGKQMTMSKDTIRKRLMTKLLSPDYVLDDGKSTYLWKNDDKTKQAAVINKSCVKAAPQPKKSKDDEDGPITYQGDALKLVMEERKKKKWIGKTGVLFNGREIMAEGIIEQVSSTGVFVNGVQGQLWMLGLRDEITED